MKSSVYKSASEYIRGCKADGDLIIDSADVKNAVMADVHMDDFDKEYLFNFYRNCMIAIAMAQNDCRALERGSGKFVNMARCTSAADIETLMQNKQKDLKASAYVWRELARMYRTIVPGQTVLDVDNPGELLWLDSMEDVIEQLVNM